MTDVTLTRPVSVLDERRLSDGFHRRIQRVWHFREVSLFVGVAPLGLAIAYVLRPAERTLAIMRPVSLAAIFAAICGLAAGLIAILMGIAATLPKPVHVANVYTGLSEALVPPFVNFGLLASAWLLVALGMMRRPRLE